MMVEGFENNECEQSYDDTDWDLGDEDDIYAPDCDSFSDTESQIGGDDLRGFVIKASTVPFTVVNKSQIMSFQQQKIEKIVERVGISGQIARGLLLKHHWCEDTAVEAFLADDKIMDRLFKTSFDDLKEQQRQAGPKANFSCPCCFCEYEANEVVEMPDCCHRMCTYCFQGYLQSQLGDGPDCVNAVCPDVKCKLTVSSDMFKELLSKEEFSKYEEYLFMAYVDKSNNAKWCPGKDCGRVIECKSREAIEITCECGEQFCFGCLREMHSPVDCETMEKW
jgi:ariadne-1